MSQDDVFRATKKKENKVTKIQLQNIKPLVDCWAVMYTPLDFSFMKLATPAGRPEVPGWPNHNYTTTTNQIPFVSFICVNWQ